jgi:Sulfotransferase family
LTATGWPNLFVVGAGKGGTTSLWHYLGQHPDAFMSAVKEPCFFATSSFPRATPVVDEARDYLRLFADSRDERLVGEASPTYLAAEEAPVRIKAASPDAKILVSLREPVDRVHSLYLEMVKNGGERRSFREAVADEVMRAIDRPPYVNSTLYAAFVQRYLETFGDRVFVLFFEELAANPRRTMRAVYRFLGVDHNFAERLNVAARNRFAMPRGELAGALIGSRPVRQAARRLVPPSLRDPIYSILLRPVDKPRPDPGTVRLLSEVFEGDVLALGELLGRPFPDAWERRFPRLAAVRAT